MLRVDFTHLEEPFDFLYDLMKGKSEDEIKEAHQNLCEFLNLQLKIFNQQLERGEIDLNL